MRVLGFGVASGIGCCGTRVRACGGEPRVFHRIRDIIQRGATAEKVSNLGKVTPNENVAEGAISSLHAIQWEAWEGLRQMGA